MSVIDIYGKKRRILKFKIFYKPKKKQFAKPLKNEKDLAAHEIQIFIGL